MVSKYDPLGKHLETISPQTLDLTLSFYSIEQILTFSLPNSALNYTAWWAYEVRPKHPHKIIWQNAGWRVEEVDLVRCQVRFRRFSSPLLHIKTELKDLPDTETISLPKLIMSNPVRTVPNLSLIIKNAAWSPVFGIPLGTLLPKGRHGLYPEITRAAAAVQNRFGCYSWGSRSQVYYCGSFAQDYKQGRFKSTRHARVHNYLQNHTIKNTGQKNTNLMVFEKINETLAKEDIILSAYTFEKMIFSDREYSFEQFCDDPDLVHIVEQLLVSWYRKQGQCQWNRT